jgi:serine/threonine protein kinase
MSYLRHTNALSLKEWFSDAHFVYIVCELCEGGSLFAHIAQHGKLDEPTAALVFGQIASGVAFCHSRSIAHRDLKPENILITSFPFVKVADFGLCDFISDSVLMRSFCGSPCYMAPECHCKIAYDGRKADIWSLGVILFAMVTGTYPWAIGNRSVMVQQILNGDYRVPEWVSAECKELIQGMLRVYADERITMEAVLAHPFFKKAERAPYAGAIRALSLEMPVPNRIRREEVIRRFKLQRAAESAQPKAQARPRICAARPMAHLKRRPSNGAVSKHLRAHAVVQSPRSANQRNDRNSTNIKPI